MNKAKGQILTGALVLGLVLLSTQTGFTQVAGRVTANGGGPLADATVQVWDSYPTGTKQGEAVTNGAGEFAFGPQAGPVDLRVIKTGFYPTVVRDLPDGTINTIMQLVAFPIVEISPIAADYWGSGTPFLGSNILTGDVIETVDPGGFVAGASQFIQGGGTYLIHAYGNEPTSSEDEGFEPGESVAFRINGIDAAVDGAVPTYDGTINGVSHNVQLVDPSVAPGATIVGNLQALGQAGGSAFITYTLTNTGGTAETFDFTAENDNGWTMISTPTKATGVTLNPGEVSAIVVEVQIPGGTLDQTLEVRFSVAASTYGSANSGAFTTLEVSTVSDIWEGGGNGLLPSGFGLAQNYPNPFNPSTLISFNLEFAGHVRLDIVNILGQHVATLVDGFRPAGVTSLTWNASDDQGHVVPTGIYFYRLQQGELSQVRKMVLMK